MRKLIALFSVIAFSLMLGSCSYGTKESVIQKEDSSSIRLVGKAKGTHLQIDENPKVFINDTDSDDFNSWNPRHLYRIPSGKHRIRVFRGDSLLIDKEVYLGSNEIKEITIP